MTTGSKSQGGIRAVGRSTSCGLGIGECRLVGAQLLGVRLQLKLRRGHARLVLLELSRGSPGFGVGERHLGYLQAVLRRLKSVVG